MRMKEEVSERLVEKIEGTFTEMVINSWDSLKHDISLLESGSVKITASVTLKAKNNTIYITKPTLTSPRKPFKFEFDDKEIKLNDENELF